jgi:hypothetical protein
VLLRLLVLLLLLLLLLLVLMALLLVLQVVVVVVAPTTVTLSGSTAAGLKTATAPPKGHHAALATRPQGTAGGLPAERRSCQSWPASVGSTFVLAP